MSDDAIGSKTCPKVIKNILKRSADKHTPKHNKYKPKEEPSNEAKQIIKDRIAAWEQHDSDAAAEMAPSVSAAPIRESDEFNDIRGTTFDRSLWV